MKAIVKEIELIKIINEKLASFHEEQLKRIGLLSNPTEAGVDWHSVVKSLNDASGILINLRDQVSLLNESKQEYALMLTKINSGFIGTLKDVISRIGGYDYLNTIMVLKDHEDLKFEEA